MLELVILLYVESLKISFLVFYVVIIIFYYN